MHRRIELANLRFDPFSKPTPLKFVPRRTKFEPSAIRHRLSAICYLPSAICHRLSAIGYLLFAICHLPSAIGYRLSAICYWLLAIRWHGQDICWNTAAPILPIPPILPIALRPSRQCVQPASSKTRKGVTPGCSRGTPATDPQKCPPACRRGPSRPSRRSLGEGGW